MSVGLKLEPAPESRGLVMTQNPGPHSSVADPVGLGWGQECALRTVSQGPSCSWLPSEEHGGYTKNWLHD